MINDYTSLQASISRWLHRSDLVSVIPDLIVLAETRFNRNLRVRQMEETFSEDVSASVVDLPTGWLEFVGAPELGEDTLDFVTRDDFKRRRKFGYGNHYAIFGSRLFIGAQLTEPATLTFDYYTRIPSLSDTAASNWLLVDGPDVYLYGALLESAPFIKDDARIETWRGLLQVALTDLQAASDRAKHSGGSLVIP